MPSTHIEDDFWTDLVNGLVARDEIDSVLDHVSACENCETIFRRHLAEFETLRTLGQPVKGADGRWTLDAFDAPVSTPVSTIERQRRNIGSLQPARRNWFTPSRLALGGLVAAAVAVFVLFPRGPKVPPPEYWLTGYTEMLDTRSGALPGDGRLKKGIEAYDAKELHQAVNLLRQASVEGPYNDIRMIYIASALTLMQDYPRGVDVTDMIDIPALPEPSRSEAKWIRYIALTGDLREKEALMLLEELAVLDNDIGELARERKRALD